jgi:hypothetical protein
VPELKAVASGWYTAMADVSEWTRIEDEFRRRALSFVVPNSAL